MNSASRVSKHLKTKKKDQNLDEEFRNINEYGWLMVDWRHNNMRMRLSSGPVYYLQLKPYFEACTVKLHKFTV